MTKNDAIVTEHHGAKATIRKLAEGGLNITHFSIVGHHTGEKVMGFYNTDDRIVFCGPIWGGFWGLSFGRIFMTTMFDDRQKDFF